MRKHLSSTPTSVEKLPHSQHGWHPAFDHVCKRRLSAKHWIRIWQMNPTISQFLTVKNVEGLKDARKQGNPRQSILVKCSRTCFLQLVIRTIRHATEQLPGIFVSQFPQHCDLQESFDGRWAEPPYNVFIREVRWLVPS